MFNFKNKIWMSFLFLMSIAFLYTAPVSGKDLYSGENGSLWTVGTANEIKRDSAHFAGNNVRILLWNQDSFTSTLIAEDVPSITGSYLWSIPLSQPSGLYFMLKIQDMEDSTNYIMSGSYFPIHPASQISYKKCFNDFLNKTEQNISIEQSLRIEQIYPNPVADVLRFSYSGLVDGSVDIYLVSALGERYNIPAAKNSGKSSVTELNVSAIPNGFYLLCIENGDQLVSERILIFK